MEYSTKIISSGSILLMGFLIYFLLDKFYFSKKIEALYNLEKASSEVSEKEEQKPKILNELPEEENIFSEKWEGENDFNIEDHEIKDPYADKTLEDLGLDLDDSFKENSKKLGLDENLHDLLN